MVLNHRNKFQCATVMFIQAIIRLSATIWHYKSGKCLLLAICWTQRFIKLLVKHILIEICIPMNGKRIFHIRFKAILVMDFWSIVNYYCIGILHFTLDYMQRFKSDRMQTKYFGGLEFIKLFTGLHLLESPTDLKYLRIFHRKKGNFITLSMQTMLFVLHRFYALWLKWRTQHKCGKLDFISATMSNE